MARERRKFRAQHLCGQQSVAKAARGAGPAGLAEAPVRIRRPVTITAGVASAGLGILRDRSTSEEYTVRLAKS
jgi:hypothetical protein